VLLINARQKNGGKERKIGKGESPLRKKTPAGKGQKERLPTTREGEERRRGGETFLVTIKDKRFPICGRIISGKEEE